MKAMVLDRVVDLAQEEKPLRLAEVPIPVAGPHELLLKVLTCGVCHTELDEIEGRTPHHPIGWNTQILLPREKPCPFPCIKPQSQS
jgi:propanol-preferring alcohol dehydrogenase